VSERHPTIFSFPVYLCRCDCALSISHFVLYIFTQCLPMVSVFSVHIMAWQNSQMEDIWSEPHGKLVVAVLYLLYTYRSDIVATFDEHTAILANCNTIHRRSPYYENSTVCDYVRTDSLRKTAEKLWPKFRETAEAC
jgi:hypothetical protein